MVTSEDLFWTKSSICKVTVFILQPIFGNKKINFLPLKDNDQNSKTFEGQETFNPIHLLIYLFISFSLRTWLQIKLLHAYSLNS